MVGLGIAPGRETVIPRSPVSPPSGNSRTITAGGIVPSSTNRTLSSAGGVARAPTDRSIRAASDVVKSSTNRGKVADTTIDPLRAVDLPDAKRRLLRIPHQPSAGARRRDRPRAIRASRHQPVCAGYGHRAVVRRDRPSRSCTPLVVRPIQRAPSASTRRRLHRPVRELVPSRRRVDRPRHAEHRRRRGRIDPHPTRCPDQELVGRCRRKIRVGLVSPDKGAVVIGLGTATRRETVVSVGIIVGSPGDGSVSSSGAIGPTSADSGSLTIRGIIASAGNSRIGLIGDVGRTSPDGRSIAGGEVAQTACDSCVLPTGRVVLPPTDGGFVADTGIVPMRPGHHSHPKRSLFWIPHQPCSCARRRDRPRTEGAGRQQPIRPGD